VRRKEEVKGERKAEIGNKESRKMVKIRTRADRRNNEKKSKKK
jgi:hypothetical protein